MALDSVIDGVVALLLVVTIGYCVMLNRKLIALRKDEGAMRALVQQLAEATGKAERSIQSLKLSASDWDRALGARLRKAERQNGLMAEHLQRSDAFLAQADDVIAEIATSLNGAQREAARLTRQFAVLEERLKKAGDTVETLGSAVTQCEARSTSTSQNVQAILQAQAIALEKLKSEAPVTIVPDRGDLLSPETPVPPPTSAAPSLRQEATARDLPLKPDRFDNDEAAQDASSPSEDALFGLRPIPKRRAAG